MKPLHLPLILPFCFILIQTAFGQVVPAQHRNSPPDAGRAELEPLRTAYSKTYLNDDGTLTAAISAGPVHYEDATGRFRDIDRTWRRSASGGFELAEGLYEAAVAAGKAGGLQVDFRSRSGDGLRLRLHSAVLADASLRNYREISAVHATEPSAVGSRLVYANAFPGTDVHYLYTDAKLKEEIHISEAARKALPEGRAAGISGEAWFGFLTEIEIDSSLDVFAEGHLIGRGGRGKGKNGAGGRASGASANIVSAAGGLAFDGESLVELRRASGAAGFFLPVDVAYFEGTGPATATPATASGRGRPALVERRIRRRFFTTEDGRHFILSAVPLSWVKDQPSGTLVFDPQVAVPLPTEDTYIHNLQSGIPTPNPLGNAYHLAVGGDARNRSLVRFTISGIPSGSRILSARMSFYGYSGTGSDVPIAIHEVLRSWTEASASWTSYNGASAWLTPGMAIGTEARLQPEQVVMWKEGNVGRWMDYDVAELVRRWTSGAANYGVLLMAQDETASLRYAYSSEHTGAALRPKLEITYAATEPLATYAYMADGSPSRVTLGANTATATLGYTARGWVATKQYRAGTQTLFSLGQEYRPDGNVLRQTTSNAPHAMAQTTASYAYDDLDRLTSATATGAAAYAHTYAYDANGNFTTRTQNGSTTTYTYSDAARPNRLTGLTGRTGAFTYDASGAVTFDGLRHVYYDYRGRVDSLRRGTGPTETYLYDAAGRRVRVGKNKSLFEDHFEDGNTLGWTADAGVWSAQSLSLAAGADAHMAYTGARFDDFDATFRLMITSATDPTYWAAIQFRKSNWYDDYLQSGYMVYLRKNGEVALFKAGYGVIASAQTGLTADQWRGLRVSAQGSRIRVWVNGVLYIDRQDEAYTGGYVSFRTYHASASFDDLVLTEGSAYYIRGAGGEVLAEYDASGTLAAEYYYAAGERVAQLRPKQALQYYLTDHLGSARRLYPSASNWAADYLPYGQVEARTGTEGESRFGFTGHETDNATELVYAGARYYDPDHGRFLQVDRFTAMYPSLTPYHYAANNPFIFTDATGDSINVMNVLISDRQNGTNYANELIAELQEITGLTLTVNGSGILSYTKSEDGAPVVNVDNEGKEVGSTDAREMLIGAVSKTDDIFVATNTYRGSMAQNEQISLNPKQIEEFVRGVQGGLNPRTLGMGMTFLHEYLHTVAGGGMKDPKELWGTGSVVDQMNIVRTQLGKDYGQRLSYMGVKLTSEGPVYIPFDRVSLSRLKSNLIPMSGSLYISF